MCDIKKRLMSLRKDQLSDIASLMALAATREDHKEDCIETVVEILSPETLLRKEPESGNAESPQ